MRIAILVVLVGACVPVSSNSGAFVHDVSVRGTTLQVERCEMQLDLGRRDVIERLTGGGRTAILTTPNCTTAGEAFRSAVADGAR